jgi:hypothetical protein
MSSKQLIERRASKAPSGVGDRWRETRVATQPEGLVSVLCNKSAPFDDRDGERRAALAMIETIPGGRITLGADKAYDVESFVEELREQGVTPHVAQNTTNRKSAIDARTTRHDGYGMSQACRHKVERVPAWLKNIASLRKVKLRGQAVVDWLFVLGLATFNLVKMRNLELAT